MADKTSVQSLPILLLSALLWPVIPILGTAVFFLRNAWSLFQIRTSQHLTGKGDVIKVLARHLLL